MYLKKILSEFFKQFKEIPDCPKLLKKLLINLNNTLKIQKRKILLF